MKPWDRNTTLAQMREDISEETFQLLSDLSDATRVAAFCPEKQPGNFVRRMYDLEDTYIRAYREIEGREPIRDGESLYDLVLEDDDY